MNARTSQAQALKDANDLLTIIANNTPVAQHVIIEQVGRNIEALTSTPAQPDNAVIDESTHFELYMLHKCHRDLQDLNQNDSGRYDDPDIEAMWGAWKARSAFSLQTSMVNAVTVDAITRIMGHASDYAQKLHVFALDNENQGAAEAATAAFNDLQVMIEQALAAKQETQPVSDQIVYLVSQPFPSDPPNTWREASEEAFYVCLPDKRRVLYAAPQPVSEPVATLRITHGGYGAVLSTHVAYALPEGTHDVYARPQPAIPEGWQIVPKEATEEQRMAGKLAMIDGEPSVTIYSAMLAAAPNPPTGSVNAHPNNT